MILGERKGISPWWFILPIFVAGLVGGGAYLANLERQRMLRFQPIAAARLLELCKKGDCGPLQPYSDECIDFLWPRKRRVPAGFKPGIYIQCINIRWESFGKALSLPQREAIYAWEHSLPND